MNKVHIYTAPVRFTHTDPAGFVFYPRFFEMFQALVEDWFNEGIGVDYSKLILEDGIGWPTAHTECDFKKPCKLGEKIDFSLDVVKLGQTSLTVRFVGRVNGEQRLVAQSVLVAIELTDGRPIPIQSALREKFALYLS